MNKKCKSKDISDRQFYNGLQIMFRENSPSTKLVSGLQYFLCIHFNDFSINFLREFKDRIDFKEVYEKLAWDGKLGLVKENKKKFKEFFGDKEWDI